MFLGQVYYFITYYVSLFVGLNLNAVILVVAFMLLDIQYMISTINVNEGMRNREFRFWLVIVITAITSIPVFVCYFMPGFREVPQT